LTEASVKIHQSTDRLSNRFCLRKTQLLIQRSSFVGFRSPSCFNLHGQHILSGLPFQTKLPLSHASLMCSLSCFGLRGEIRSSPTYSQLPRSSQVLHSWLCLSRVVTHRVPIQTFHLRNGSITQQLSCVPSFNSLIPAECLR